jgi:integrase
VIPLHSKIVRAGFLDYVRELPSQDGALFPGLRRSARGKVGKVVGELFNKKRRALGIVRDGNGLDFHSWRHTVATKLKWAKVAEDDRNDVMGHAQATETSKTYEHGPDIHHLKSVIEKIGYDDPNA